MELLARVRIPDARRRASQYPFEFSGGMLQRAMIAAAIACEPALLIADEPTTALDVTIQAQILDLLQDLQNANGMAIVLITHDLAVVARMADTVAVMYAGQIVEQAPVDDLFYRAAHPYTRGLQAAIPANDPNRSRSLEPIEGSPPDLFQPPPGCAYAARCPHAMRICAREAPPALRRETTTDGTEGRWKLLANAATGEDSSIEAHVVRCWLHHPSNRATT
jgi:oligopeptide/dipeptide ABC transporter ATP-binding protein